MKERTIQIGELASECLEEIKGKRRPRSDSEAIEIAILVAWIRVYGDSEATPEKWKRALRWLGENQP